MSSENYRVKQWTAPPRPKWVQHVNEEGACLDIRSIVPLDEESLIARARANTGLSDFGDDAWREPFRVLLKSLEEEAQLNLMGRILTRSDILMYLEARLRIEDTYKRHPEITDVELAPAFLIAGSGRSGTSALQNLLTQDPDNGTILHWEALFPCPPPEAATYRTDPRIELADQRMTQWNRVTPEIASVHEFAGAMPTELIQLEGLSFSDGWMLFCGFTPTYDIFISRRSKAPALAYAKRVMKLLQWKNPRKRWILKSPYAMRYLPALFEVFPDIRLIWTHRDPLMSVSSAVNMVGTILSVRSDQPLSPAAVSHLTDPAGLAEYFDHVLDQIASGAISADRFIHMQYLDFIADPIATAKQLYRDMGIEFTPQARQAMERYQREHRREGRPKHQYNVGESAQHAEERKIFARYLEYSKVKLEL